MKTAATYLASLVLVPLLMLLLIEGVVRIVGPEDLKLQRIDRTLIDDRAGVFPHVNRAGFLGEVREEPVTINAHHLRGPTVTEDERLRVLLLGDSVWFGLGVSDGEAPTAVLTPLLGDTVQVLNSGTIGYGTAHQVAFLSEFGDELRPDVVLLGYTLNDAVPSQMSSVQVSGTPDGEGSYLRHVATRVNEVLRSRSRAFVGLKGLLGLERARHGYPVHAALYADSLWARHAQDLDRLRQWCEQREVPLGLVLTPHRDQLLEEATEARPQQRLAAYGAAASLPVLDLRSALQADHFLYGDPIHLDARGMAVSMQAVARFLPRVLRASPDRAPASTS